MYTHLLLLAVALVYIIYKTLLWGKVRLLPIQTRAPRSSVSALLLDRKQKVIDIYIPKRKKERKEEEVNLIFVLCGWRER